MPNGVFFESSENHKWTYVSYGNDHFWTTSEAISPQTCGKNQHFQILFWGRKYFTPKEILEVVYFSTRLRRNGLRGGPKVTISVWNVTPFVIFWGLQKYSFGLRGVCPKWRGWSKMCGRPPIPTFYSRSKLEFLKNAKIRKRIYVSYINEYFCTTSEAISPQTCGKIQHFQILFWGAKYFTPKEIPSALDFSARPLEKLNPGTAKIEISVKSI